MQFEHEQSESCGVRRPSPQMAHEILFEFIRADQPTAMREGAGRSARARVRLVVDQSSVRTVVIQKRAHMKQLVTVDAALLELVGEIGWPIDVAGDDLITRNPLRAQLACGLSPRHLVE